VPAAFHEKASEIKKGPFAIGERPLFVEFLLDDDPRASTQGTLKSICQTLSAPTAEADGV
jgi:hypothetical protein